MAEGWRGVLSGGLRWWWGSCCLGTISSCVISELNFLGGIGSQVPIDPFSASLSVLEALCSLRMTLSIGGAAWTSRRRTIFCNILLCNWNTSRAVLG